MLLLIIAVYAFYRGAQKRKLIPWLWAVIGGVSYFAGPFIVGIIIGLTDLYSLYDEGAINVYAFISVVASLIIAYVTMVVVGDRREKREEDLSVLDDQF